VFQREKFSKKCKTHEAVIFLHMLETEISYLKKIAAGQKDEI
jgi:hypothetical protein